MEVSNTNCTNFHGTQLGLDSKLNWKKIGEVHSNAQWKCLIVCMICEKLENAYATNDAFEFWKHIQSQHLDFKLFNEELPQDSHEACGSQVADNHDENADLTNIAYSVNTNDTLPTSNLHPDTNNGQEQHPDCTDSNHGVEININDNFSQDTENIVADTNNCNNETVDLSQDESVPKDLLRENVETIELSDEEDLIGSVEAGSTFTTRLGEVFCCDFCGDLFIDQNTLNEHKAAHKNVIVDNEVLHSRLQASATDFVGSQPYVESYHCKFCGIHFPSIELCEKHQMMHDIQTYRGFQDKNMSVRVHCKQCDKHFCSRNSLKRHELSAHKISTANVPYSNQQKAFKCYICGRRTTTEASMYVHHQRFHSNESHPKTVTCKVCDKVVALRSIRGHMKAVHSDKRKTDCPYCSRWYMSRQKLGEHIENVHCIQLVPQNQTDTIFHESLSSSPSATFWADAITEEDSANVHSQYQNMIEPPSSDEAMYDDDIIIHGEVIPMDSTKVNAW